MGNVREDVLEDVESHSETLDLADFVRLIEEQTHEAEPGVSRETLADYAEAAYFDVDLDQLDDHVTDSEGWAPGDRLYEVRDGRVSAYPRNWHEAFGGLDDFRDLIAVIQSEVTESEGSMYESVTEKGIPEEKLLRVAKVTEGIDRDASRERLEDLRHRGEIEGYASQNKNPTVRLE